MMPVSQSKCGSCGKIAVSAVRLDCYETTLNHDGREYSFSIPNLDVRRCGVCETVFLDDDADERVTSALYAAAGLLYPHEIRAARERLGLKQSDIAELTGIAASTISRWENGVQIQQRCMDNFLRVFFDLSQTRKYLATPKELRTTETESLAARVFEPTRLAREAALAWLMKSANADSTGWSRAFATTGAQAGLTQSLEGMPQAMISVPARPTTPPSFKLVA